MVEWTHIAGIAPYAETLAAMEARVAAIAAGTRARGDLAAGTPAALHRRHLGASPPT